MGMNIIMWKMRSLWEFESFAAAGIYDKLVRALGAADASWRGLC